MEGMLEREIVELRQLRYDFRKGVVDANHVNTEIAIYSQVEKRARVLLHAHIALGDVKNDLPKEIFGDGLPKALEVK